MSTPSNTLLACWVLLATFFSSCTKPAENAIASPTQTPLPATSAATSVPSFTPISTNSPVPTLNATLIPPLPVEQAQAKLLELMSDNSGCRLPCLWGITPGMSSYQEAQAILMPLTDISVLTSFRPEGGAIFPVYVKDDLELYTGAGFNVDTRSTNQIVNMIGFVAEAHHPLEQGGYEDVFDSVFFSEKVSAYTLQRVLSEQGVPSSVMLATFGAPLTRGGTGGFDILLLYPDQGILVNYTTQMYLIESNVRGCPSNAHVEIELYPPGEGDSFFERLKLSDWAVKMNYYKPLGEVTNLSAQEFHERFQESNDKCIETPAMLWPTPEP